MAVEIRHYTATIAAGTAKLAPAAVSIAMPPRSVLQIDWRVPTGPMGLFGWQLAMGGTVVFPVGSDQFVLADGQSGTWTPSRAPDSGAWQVIGYNTGANPHSVYLAFHVDPPAKAVQLAELIPAYALGPAPDLSKAGPPVRRPR